MTDDEAIETGRAAYRAAQHPPMPDDLVAKLGALLAPLNDQPAPVNATAKPEERAA